MRKLTYDLSGHQVWALSNYEMSWIQGELVKLRYTDALPSRKRGRYLMKISGYSCQQLSRLIAQYSTAKWAGYRRRRQRTKSGFKQKYTEKISACWRRWMSTLTDCGSIKKLRERGCKV